MHTGRYRHLDEHPGGGRTGKEDIALIQHDNTATHNGCNDEAPSHGPPPWPQRFGTCSSIAVEESAQQRDTKGNERGQQHFEHDPTRYVPGQDGVAMMHRNQQTAHQDCRQEGSANHLARAEEGQTWTPGALHCMWRWRGHAMLSPR